MSRARLVLWIVFATHVVAGFMTIVSLVASTPWQLREDTVEGVIQRLAPIDFRWWVLLPVVVIWIAPIAVVLLWRRANETGAALAQLSERMGRMLEGRQIPIAVDVDARVPVRISQPLRVPVEIDARVPVDESVEVEAEVPVSIVLPIDTEVETRVLRFGTLTVPIRAEIPIDLVIPVKGSIRVKSAGLAVRLREEATVRLPEFEVPVAARLETRIDLQGSLRAAEELARKRRAAGGE